ncbi:hypothetical protein BDE02_16G054500 [Populus trichocarpa]|nr:hypothetical protein BDE02_16G054500 [Populus trichocarpa]
MKVEESTENELEQSESSTVMREKKAIYLVWEDVTAVVAKNSGKGATRKLLNRQSGYALPDRIMAIMGPSGSGKSTLLDALAGRLSSNVIMSGNVLLNGKQRKIGNGSIFFAEAGFPCPTRRNPSDHFLRCINSDFDKMASTLLRSLRDSAVSVPSNFETSFTTEDIKAKLIEKYRSSEYSINTRTKIRQIALINEELMSGLIEIRINWWKQLYTLTIRSFVNMIRDLGYFWVRTFFYILISLGAGIMYFDVGLSNSAFVTRAKCYTYVYDFLICLSVGGLPSFLEEWKVSYHELLNRHYGEAVFMLSNFFASFIFLVIMSLSSGTIVFYMVKFHLGFSHYCYLCMNFFFCFAIMESVAMIVALLVPNFLMGIGVSAFAVMFLSMASGLYRPLPDLPKFFWRYPMAYISFTSWAVQGQFKNDMLGLEFEPFVQGEPKIQGKQILHDFFGVRVNYSKWWDLAALLLLLLCHKLLFLSILKYKQRLVLLLRRFCAKRTLKALALRPSFRKEKYGSSRRNQPLHPLSAQEGLASPLS